MNYEKLSENIKINVMSYLDYETNTSLSLTNKSNNFLYNKIKETKYVSLYSTRKCYIHKNDRNLNNIFYTLLFVKIVSYDKDYITYKHIKYGNYYNNVYPINSYLLYFLSHDIINPSYLTNIIESKSRFDSQYILYENKNEINTFRNKYFFIQFVLHSLCIYIFLYIPLIIALYLFYLFYYLFFILCIFVYTFHILLMYEILLTAIVSRNINFI